MKSKLALFAIATSLIVAPASVQAAQKYNERWQKVEEYRKELVEKHRSWVASNAPSQPVSTSVSAAPVSTDIKPQATQPKPVTLASISKKKRKLTSSRIGSTARHLGRVEARVDLSEQRMRVYANGRLKYVWKVSTARAGKVTPTGTWTAKWLSKNHRSSRYNGAPMPYSIFYSGNFAVHGTPHVKRLGSPASAGCVRLHTDNARILFRLAQNVGLRNLKVRVVR